MKNGIRVLFDRMRRLSTISGGAVAAETPRNAPFQAQAAGNADSAEPGKLISRVYIEMGLPAPSVRHYPSLPEAVADFHNWRSEVSPIVAVFWDYQYPVLNPSSYWAQSHLRREGLQFDLTRGSNGYGCYDRPRYVSKIPIPVDVLAEHYEFSAAKAVSSNAENAIDRTAVRFRKDYPKLISILDRKLSKEEPTDQMGVESYIFLGAFQWLRIERDILRDMRDWLQMPLCDEHYRNVTSLCGSNALFLTFRRLVLWAPLPG